MEKTAQDVSLPRQQTGQSEKVPSKTMLASGGKVQSTVSSKQRVDRQGPATLADAAGLSRLSIDNSQSNSASNPLPPTINREPLTINKRGFLPRLGPRQMIALLAIVVIFLVIGFFVFERKGNVSSGQPKEEKLDKPMSAIQDIKFATDEAKSKEYFDELNNTYVENKDNYRSTLIYIIYTCQSQKLSADDKAKLKSAYDEVLAKADKSKPEATESPYVWYCE